MQPLLAMNDNAEDHDMSTEARRWKRLRENHDYFDYVKDEPKERTTSDWRVCAKI